MVTLSFVSADANLGTQAACKLHLVAAGLALEGITVTMQMMSYDDEGEFDGEPSTNPGSGGEGD
jgi:hypothetical protein